MPKRIGLVAIFAILGVACKADCQSLCEEWAEEECCSKNDLGENCVDDVDACEEDCEDLERLVERAGCEEEFDTWNECAADLDDICDDTSDCTYQDGSTTCSGGACDSEVEAYFECVDAYCGDNPNSSVCN